MGYPARYVLKRWILEIRPELLEKHRASCTESKHLVRYTQEQKQEAVEATLIHGIPDYKVAAQYGVSRATLYNWKRRLLGRVVRRIMRQEKLEVYVSSHRKYSFYMGEISPEVPNILQRHFHAAAPNQKWLTDLTEFALPAGKVYLSPVIDCFDGMVHSWTIGTSPNAQLVNNMLEKALTNLRPGEHPIIHSDRGCHYRWPDWIK